ncbi:unnamed protein product, partial [marine sediment metagenome]
MDSDTLWSIVEGVKDAVADVIRGPINDIGGWIEEVYRDISSEVWGAIDWIDRQITDAYDTVKGVMTEGFHYVTDYTYDVINDVATAIDSASDTQEPTLL